jgi:hypothetical protein
MTDAIDPVAQACFDDIVRSRGGVSAFSSYQVRLAVMIATLAVSADAAEMVKNADLITRLTELLPAQSADVGGKPWDLSLLSDTELAEVERLQAVATGAAPPTPEVIEPEPEMGACEMAARSVGQYLDQHCMQWRGRPLTEDERIELCNQFSSLGYTAGVLTRELWRPVYDSERNADVSSAVEAERLRLAGVAAAAEIAAQPARPAPDSNVIRLALGYDDPSGGMR